MKLTRALVIQNSPSAAYNDGFFSEKIRQSFCPLRLNCWVTEALKAAARCGRCLTVILLLMDISSMSMDLNDQTGEHTGKEEHVDEKGNSSPFISEGLRASHCSAFSASRPRPLI